MVAASAPSGISALLRGVRGGPLALPQRPKGPLVWLHLPQGIPEDAIAELKATLDEVHILITYSGVVPSEDMVAPLPGPRKTAIDGFIEHWRPDLLVWGSPKNGLPILRRAKRAGVKMLFADLCGQNLPTGFRGRQFSEFVQSFEKILLVGPLDQALLLPQSIAENQLVSCKPLSEIATVLPEDESLFRRISGALVARPIWCAARVSRGEMGAILAAHRHAVKAVPNLLLIVAPRGAVDVIDKRIQEDGWRMARIGPNALPDRQAEVLLAPDAENLGVWLRLAAVSYMGGTLYGPEAADPFLPLAVGSAVLCGPNHQPFERRYERLHQAGALAEAETNGAFAAKLVETLSPDQSAQLALKAWEVGSDGAEAVAVLAGEISAILESGAS